MGTTAEMILPAKYKNAFANAPKLTESASWLRTLRTKSYKRFQDVGFPTRAHEDWRYINLESLLETVFARPEDIVPHVDQDQLVQYIISQENPRLVLVNERFFEEGSSLESLPERVLLKPLSHALETHAPRVELSFATSVEEEQNPFALLNNLHFREGAVLFVPEGMAIEKPIEILLITTDVNKGPTVSYPRLFISLGAESQANVVITCLSLSKERSFQNVVIDFSLGERAKLSTTCLQRNGIQELQFVTTHIRQAKESSFHFTTLTHGGRITRNEIQTSLRGEGATCSLNGLGLLTNESQVHQHPTAHHQKPHSVSRQLYKNILNGRARSEFNSMSHIYRGSVKSDSGQLNRNMILSKTARALSRPQLKVYNDDVIAAHGSTTGQVSNEELFYLRSRGLSKDLATSMLVYGFAEEIVDGIPVKSIRQHAEAFVRSDLHEVVAHAI